MDEFKGTKRRDEPGDMEVLFLEPSWHDDKVSIQSLAIAPLEDGTLSIICNKLYKGERTSFIHLILTQEETDMIVDALKEAKKRWKKYGK